MAVRKQLATPRAKSSAAQRGPARKAPASDVVVSALAEYEKKPKGTEQRFQAFRKVLKAVHDEHAK